MEINIKKITSHKVFQNFSVLMIGNILMQLLNVIAIIYVTKIFRPESFGLFSYMISQSLLLATVADLGIRNIAIRTIARDISLKNKIISTSVISILISNFVLYLIYYIYNYKFGSLSNTQVLLVSISSFVICLSAITEYAFIGLQKMANIAMSGIAYSLIWLTIVLLLRGHEISINLLFLFYISTTAIKPLILGVKLILKFNLKLELANFFSNYKILLKESSPYWGLVLVALPANYLANNFLEINSTIDQVGYFSLATKFALPISMILNVLLSALFPNISVIWASDPDRFNRLVNKSVPIFIITGGILAFFLTIILKPIFNIFFASEYLSAVLICKIQVWYTVLMGCCSLIGTIWGAMNKEKLAFKMAIINSIINTPLLWFGSKYGGYGLSIAYVLSFAIFMVLLWVTFLKTNYLKKRSSFAWLVVSVLFALSLVI
ncbi:MAG: oligosaccharide flippase family protein [Bacteroidales bacterium]